MSDQDGEGTSSLEPRDRALRRGVLEDAIEQGWQDLLTGIRIYVRKFGLVSDAPTVDVLAREILQDTVVTALQRADNYDPERPARPWLLGISINHIRRRVRVRAAESNVVLVDDTKLSREHAGKDSKGPTADEMFDLLLRSSRNFRPGQLTLDELLSLVGETDREVLRLVFIEGLRGKSLAAELGVSEGAAWARTSRAIAKFRKAYLHSEQTGQKGN